METIKISKEVIQMAKILRAYGCTYHQIKDTLNIAYGSAYKFSSKITILPEALRKIYRAFKVKLTMELIISFLKDYAEYIDGEIEKYKELCENSLSRKQKGFHKYMVNLLENHKKETNNY